MKSPKKYNYIFLAVLVVSIVILLVGMTSESIPLLGIGFLLAFGSFVFRTITDRKSVV